MHTKSIIATLALFLALPAFADDKSSVSPVDLSNRIVVLVAEYCKNSQATTGMEFTECFSKMTDKVIAQVENNIMLSNALKTKTN